MPGLWLKTDGSLIAQRTLLDSWCTGEVNLNRGVPYKVTADIIHLVLLIYCERSACQAVRKGSFKWVFLDRGYINVDWNGNCQQEMDQFLMPPCDGQRKRAVSLPLLGIMSFITKNKARPARYVIWHRRLPGIDNFVKMLLTLHTECRIRRQAACRCLTASCLAALWWKSRVWQSCRPAVSFDVDSDVSVIA